LLIQLGADCPAAENARCGADDLTPTHELSTLKADGRACLSAPANLSIDTVAAKRVTRSKVKAMVRA